MQLESAKYLRDILDAAGAIQDYVRGKQFEDFLNTRSLRDAVHWNFCVIGEAVSQLRTIDEPTVEKLSGYWKIVGLRNQLIHGYGVIDSRITWGIIEDKLPILVREAKQLLGEP
jgi:uncharacterized protein with HEPN domain